MIFFYETLTLCSNSLRKDYSAVFEVSDYESKVKISKFNMAVY